MLNAKNISYYLISLSNHNIEDEFTNLKLQKILYYLQGHYLAINETPLFEDSIEAWDLGPVVSDVYHTFKSYGNGTIIMPETETNFDFISKESKAFINNVYTYYRQFSALKLVDMTHNEKPWTLTYKKSMSNVIGNDLLKDYFKTTEINQSFVSGDVVEERKKAAMMLAPDYIFDKELTEFSKLDSEAYYEL